MDKNYLSIPKRLAEYRKLMDLSQTQMGEKFGVTQSHYSKLESGLKGVSFRNLKCFEENGGDAFFLITGDHRREGEMERYLETGGSVYEKTRIFEILVWAAETGGGCTGDNGVVLTERTGKCIRLIRNYSEDMSVWRNIRKAEDCSQEDMAKIFDINIKRYRSIEKGESMPDAEILQTLYEKMHYSPLLILDRRMYYLDELNRVWEALPEECLKEARILMDQAVKIVHMTQKRKAERKE